MLRKFTFFLIVVLFGNCTKPRVSIEVDRITTTNRPVDFFAISQFKRDHLDLIDIRPKKHIEVMRYCCEAKENRPRSKTVYFADTLNFRWSLCKLDTSYVTVETLNETSLKKVITETDIILKLPTNNQNAYFKLPFSIDSGYVYQIFGLNDLNRSCYFCLDEEKNIVIQFFEKGPW